MSDKNEEIESPVPPSWIDKALIQKAIHNDGAEDAEVTEIAVNCATAPGDNYGSTIYRVKATLTDGRDTSFILKGQAQAKSIAEGSKESGVFRRESVMLAEVIPQIQAMLEEVVPDRNPPFAPRCCLSGDSPEEFIIMEDLGRSGFRLADRKRGLGLRHCLLAVRALARFHAASHLLLKRRPELHERLDNLWRNPDSAAAMGGILEGGLQATADACRAWPGFEKYAAGIEKLKDGVMEKYVEATEPTPGGFHVICHGDFWVNNMMFRYENGSPAEMRAVDFQLPHVASPGTDLVYFLAASVSETVHKHHQGLLIREYYHELKSILTLLGVEEIPSLQALQAELDERWPLGVAIGLSSMPIMKADKAANIEELMQGDASGSKGPLQQEDVRRWLQRTIPEFHAKGWISG